MSRAFLSNSCGVSCPLGSVIRLVSVSSRHISSIKEVVSLTQHKHTHTLTLEDLRAVCTEVSGRLVNDDGFTLTLPNEIYGIHGGCTIFVSHFRAFLILQQYRRGAASCSSSPTTTTTTTTEQEIQSVVPGEMPRGHLLPPLDDPDVFLPHRRLGSEELLGLWCLLWILSSRWGRLCETLIMSGSLLWTSLVASAFEVIFQLSQCDVALPRAMRGLYLLLAFLIATTTCHHWSTAPL